MKQVGIYFFEDDVPLDKIYNMNFVFQQAIAKVCDICGKPTQGFSYNVCKECNTKKEIERYKKLPEQESDMYYSEYFDKYYPADSIVEDLLEDILYNTSNDNYKEVIKNLKDFKYENLLLYSCNKHYASPIDTDYIEEDAYEDFELPEDIQKDIEALNKKLQQICTGYYYNSNFKIPNKVFSELDFEMMKKDIETELRKEDKENEY